LQYEGKGKAPWRKVLYEDQPYEDNYTDKPTFLIGMITNGTSPCTRVAQTTTIARV
jgi:hypothetical protein